MIGVRKTVPILLLAIFISTISILPAYAFQKSDLQEGDIVQFGSFTQTDEKKEEIRWIVLKEEEEKALLLSEQILDSFPYHSEPGKTRWDTCFLESWLNTTFLSEAFDVSESEEILQERILTEENQKYHTGKTVETEEKVFILSEQEAREYFSGREDRTASVTDFAAKQGAAVSETNDMGYWWLRTIGENEEMAMYVGAEGSVAESGFPAVRQDIGVRPALWIRLY